MPLPITLQDVRAAAERHARVGLVKRTPLMTCQSISDRVGRRLYWKCENLQLGGAFKIRGALNFLLANEAEVRSRGVVAFSSGNHAQGVALAARHLGVHATIVMPTDAPAPKLAATKGYGAEIVLYDRVAQDREQIAREIQQRTGALLVPPFDHPLIMAGQGTAALELLADAPEPIGTIITPCGGGGLLSGTCIAAESSPGTRVYGAEPALGDDTAQSLEKGERVRIPQPHTIADGAAVTMPGELTFQVIKARAAGILRVPEDSMLRAMALFSERMKLVVEPTGALGTAALLDGFLPPGEGAIALLVSGGNVLPEVMCRALSGGA